jgi:hypothetical protein
VRRDRSKPAPPRPGGQVIPDNFCAKLRQSNAKEWPERRTIRTAYIIAEEANHVA